VGLSVPGDLSAGAVSAPAGWNGTAGGKFTRRMAGVRTSRGAGNVRNVGRGMYPSGVWDCIRPRPQIYPDYTSGVLGIYPLGGKVCTCRSGTISPNARNSLAGGAVSAAGREIYPQENRGIDPLRDGECKSRGIRVCYHQRSVILPAGNLKQNPPGGLRLYSPNWR
jgi:hypothetical protein